MNDLELEDDDLFAEDAEINNNIEVERIPTPFDRTEICITRLKGDKLQLLNYSIYDCTEENIKDWINQVCPSAPLEKFDLAKDAGKEELMAYIIEVHAVLQKILGRNMNHLNGYQ